MTIILGPVRYTLCLVPTRINFRRKSTTKPDTTAVAIQTDGSYIPGLPPRSGIGCYIGPHHRSNLGAPLIPSSHCSTGAEIQAAITGLEILLREHPHAKTYRIITDCHAVVDMLRGHFKGKESWLQSNCYAVARIQLLKAFTQIAGEGARLEVVQVAREEIFEAHQLAKKAALSAGMGGGETETGAARKKKEAGEARTSELPDVAESMMTAARKKEGKDSPDPVDSRKTNQVKVKAKAKTKEKTQKETNTPNKLVESKKLANQPKTKMSRKKEKEKEPKTKGDTEVKKGKSKTSQKRK